MTILLTSDVEAMAQSDNIHLKIRSMIYYAPGHDLFSTKPYSNKAFTFGIAIGVDKMGIVDTVIFTNRTKMLDSIVSFSYMTKQLKNQKRLFLAYKNTVIVAIVLVRRSWDSNIDNFYNSYYKNKYPELPDFDNYLLGAMPDIENLSKSRKVKLLPTIDFVRPMVRH